MIQNANPPNQEPYNAPDLAQKEVETEEDWFSDV